MSRLGRTLGLDRVAPTVAEVTAAMPGDDLVAPADVVMDRAFTVTAPEDEVWPWLVQLGKRRAGWYLPRSVERAVPRSRRAARHIDQQCQHLTVGDVIPDYGGADATFTVAEISPHSTLVYTSERGYTHLTWALTLTPTDGTSTRVRMRLRLAPVKRPWLADSVGGLVDLLTIAGLAAGLQERLAATQTPQER